MKFSVKLLSLVASAVAVMTSCVNDGLQEPQDAAALKMIRPLDEQKAAVEASMEELHDLQAALEECDVKLSGMEAVQQRVASLSQAKSLEEGTLAAFELQKRIASILGPAIASLDSETYESEFSASFDSLEKGIVKWVGENFTSLYPVVLADAKAQVTMSEIDATIAKQQLYVDALESDIKAGLKKDENPDEMASLTASMQEVTAGKEKIGAETAALVAEVEKGYETAVKSILSDPTSYSAASLKELNENAVAAMASSSTSVEDLAERVAACESQLNSILQRLSALETEIEDLEELLGMVQSVTFMSEFSEDKAIAYYTMNVNGTADAQGRKPRTGESTMELKWIVRPASAAAALTSSSLWDNGLKVFGYYASAMTKAAGDFFNYDITKVTADQTLGVVTVTVANTLSKEFYFKETGAKLALSLTTGNTDLTSKFVEIVPKDKSGNVYVEGLELSAQSIEIDNGLTEKLLAAVSPSDVTTGGVNWKSSNTDILTVASDGTITTKSVGSAVVTATTKGVDEWGNAISAQCSVKVNPAVKLVGPAYVEEGKTIEISVESPDYISPEYISWELTGITNPSFYATVTSENGVCKIKGIANTFDTSSKAYKTISAKCTISGAIPVELYHEFRVVVVQPKGVTVEGIAYDQNSLVLKKDQGYTFKTSLQPEGEVNSTYFRIQYQTNNAGVVRVPDVNSGYVVANSVGEARIDIKTTDNGQYNYFYPARAENVRSVYVKVEPYYVETVTMDSPIRLAPGADPVILPVTFTSDVEGEAPTYTGVKWSMSAEDAAKGVITLDPDTGQITPLAEGTVTVIATTYEDGAVPNGSSHKSGECLVIVETQQNPVNVGGYYYSDGTWGSAPNPSGKSVIGVIFSTANAALGDSMLSADGYSACVNGLAVSTVEYTSAFGYISTGYNSTGKWFIERGYDNVNTTKPNGYSNTKGLIAYDTEKDSGHSLSSTAVARIPSQHAGSVTSPDKASSWYIPSYYEMYLLYQNMSTVNSAMSAVSGTQISASDYWSSSLQWTNDGYKDIPYMYPFSMQSGGWASYCDKSKALPVRVILAF